MKKALSIKVSKDRVNGGLVTIRQTTIRDRLLKHLFGCPTKIAVIVPGDSISEVGIAEVPEDIQDGKNDGRSVT